MNQAVIKMCDDWGVPPENVRFEISEVSTKSIRQTASQQIVSFLN